MSLFSLTTFVLLCAAPESVPAATAETPAAEAAPAEATPHQVREAVRNLLQREATAKTPEERAAAVRDLAVMYEAVRRDTKMAESQRKFIKGKMYSRLVRVKQDLENDIKRRREEAEKLAKRGGTGILPVQISGDTGTLAENVSGTGETPVAPGETPVAQGAGGGLGVRDDGEVLVELIQKTIAPTSWDVNGGPGSIIYYSNLHVLVVRASGDVHGHVGGLFEGLRAVGGP